MTASDKQTPSWVFKGITDTINDHLVNNDPTWRFPEENTEIPLSELHKRSINISKYLTEKNIKAGDRVGLLLHNGADYVSLLLALWRIHAIAVPYRPLTAALTDYKTTLARILENCRFSAIVFSENTSPGILASWKMDGGGTTIMESELPRNDSTAPMEPCILNENEVAIIQYSSGSTGQPKGIIVTHGMLFAQVQQQVLEYFRRWRLKLESMGSWLPMYHDLGLIMGVVAPLYIGAKNIVASPKFFMANPTRWFRILDRNKVQLSTTTNTAMNFSLRFLESEADGSMNLSSLRLGFGAEKVSPIILSRTREQLGRFSLPPDQLINAYGMAENTLICSATSEKGIQILSARINDDGTVSVFERSSAGAMELVSVGSVFSGTDVEIRDSAGRTLPDLHLGEIVIRGKCMSRGYFNNKDLTRRTFNDGWFHSNDLGFIYQNELFYVSRKDDLIIMAGRNIIPEDIEQCVETIDFVKPGTSILFMVENDSTGTAELHLLIEANGLLSPQQQNERRRKVQLKIMSEFELLVNLVSFCAKGTVEKTSSGKKRRKIITERFRKGKITIIG
jgi:acyl-CoA synthetase (AMP-forming)/AMP-acid ligase II